jgi:predicted XRE-type DNA-binding protein
MKHEKFDNVWFALEANEADAINMTLRSDLMTSIERSVATWKLSQTEAAKRLGITCPRVNDFLRGKISKFSLDTLTTLAMKAGLTVKMSVKKTVVKRAAQVKCTVIVTTAKSRRMNGSKHLHGQTPLL